MPGQPDLYDGDVLSVVGSSSLAEASPAFSGNFGSLEDPMNRKGSM